VGWSSCELSTSGSGSSVSVSSACRRLVLERDALHRAAFHEEVVRGDGGGVERRVVVEDDGVDLLAVAVDARVSAQAGERGGLGGEGQGEGEAEQRGQAAFSEMLEQFDHPFFLAGLMPAHIALTLAGAS
jgi:hypothetical protein